jgi:hypothetical protein
MRLLYSIVLTVAMIAVTSCSQPAAKKESFADPQEVLDAFNKLNSSIEVGVTYNKYIDNLTDVNTALTKYSESGKANPSEVKLLEKAFSGYLIAGEFWGCDFKDVNIDEYKCRDTKILEASALLPDVANNDGVKNAIANKRGADDYISIKLDKKAVLSLIWLSSEKQVVLAKVKE